MSASSMSLDTKMPNIDPTASCYVNILPAFVGASLLSDRARHVAGLYDAITYDEASEMVTTGAFLMGAAVGQPAIGSPATSDQSLVTSSKSLESVLEVSLATRPFSMSTKNGIRRSSVTSSVGAVSSMGSEADLLASHFLLATPGSSVLPLPHDDESDPAIIAATSHAEQYTEQQEPGNRPLQPSRSQSPEVSYRASSLPTSRAHSPPMLSMQSHGSDWHLDRTPSPGSPGSQSVSLLPSKITLFQSAMLSATAEAAPAEGPSRRGSGAVGQQQYQELPLGARQPALQSGMHRARSTSSLVGPSRLPRWTGKLAATAAAAATTLASDQRSSKHHRSNDTISGMEDIMDESCRLDAFGSSERLALPSSSLLQPPRASNGRSTTAAAAAANDFVSNSVKLKPALAGPRLGSLTLLGSSRPDEKPSRMPAYRPALSASSVTVKTVHKKPDEIDSYVPRAQGNRAAAATVDVTAAAASFVKTGPVTTAGQSSATIKAAPALTQANEGQLLPAGGTNRSSERVVTQPGQQNQQQQQQQTVFAMQHSQAADDGASHAKIRETPLEQFIYQPRFRPDTSALQSELHHPGTNILAATHSYATAALSSDSDQPSRAWSFDLDPSLMSLIAQQPIDAHPPTSHHLSSSHSATLQLNRSANDVRPHHKEQREVASDWLSRRGSKADTSKDERSSISTKWHDGSRGIPSSGITERIELTRSAEEEASYAAAKRGSFSELRPSATSQERRPPVDHDNLNPKKRQNRVTANDEEQISMQKAGSPSLGADQVPSNSIDKHSVRTEAPSAKATSATRQQAAHEKDGRSQSALHQSSMQGRKAVAGVGASVSVASGEAQSLEVLTELQQSYADLLTKYALAEVTIDQLRLGAKLKVDGKPTGGMKSASSAMLGSQSFAAPPLPINHQVADDGLRRMSVSSGSGFHIRLAFKTKALDDEIEQLLQQIMENKTKTVSAVPRAKYVRLRAALAELQQECGMHQQAADDSTAGAQGNLKMAVKLQQMTQKLSTIDRELQKLMESSAITDLYPADDGSSLDAGSITVAGKPSVTGKRLADAVRGTASALDTSRSSGRPKEAAAKPQATADLGSDRFSQKVNRRSQSPSPTSGSTSRRVAAGADANDVSSDQRGRERSSSIADELKDATARQPNAGGSGPTAVATSGSPSRGDAAWQASSKARPQSGGRRMQESPSKADQHTKSKPEEGQVTVRWQDAAHDGMLPPRHGSHVVGVQGSALSLMTMTTKDLNGVRSSCQAAAVDARPWLATQLSNTTGSVMETSALHAGPLSTTGSASISALSAAEEQESRADSIGLLITGNSSHQTASGSASWLLDSAVLPGESGMSSTGQPALLRDVNPAGEHLLQSTYGQLQEVATLLKGIMHTTATGAAIGQKEPASGGSTPSQRRRQKLKDLLGEVMQLKLDVAHAEPPVRRQENAHPGHSQWRATGTEAAAPAEQPRLHRQRSSPSRPADGKPGARMTTGNSRQHSAAAPSDQAEQWPSQRQPSSRRRLFSSGGAAMPDGDDVRAPDQRATSLERGRRGSSGGSARWQHWSRSSGRQAASATDASSDSSLPSDEPTPRGRARRPSSRDRIRRPSSAGAAVVAPARAAAAAAAVVTEAAAGAAPARSRDRQIPHVQEHDWYGHRLRRRSRSWAGDMDEHPAGEQRLWRDRHQEDASMPDQGLSARAAAAVPTAAAATPGRWPPQATSRRAAYGNSRLPNDAVQSADAEEGGGLACEFVEPVLEQDWDRGGGGGSSSRSPLLLQPTYPRSGRQHDSALGRSARPNRDQQASQFGTPVLDGRRRRSSVRPSDAMPWQQPQALPTAEAAAAAVGSARLHAADGGIRAAAAGRASVGGRRVTFSTGDGWSATNDNAGEQAFVDGNQWERWSADGDRASWLSSGPRSPVRGALASHLPNPILLPQQRAAADSSTERMQAPPYPLEHPHLSARPGQRFDSMQFAPPTYSEGSVSNWPAYPSRRRADHWQQSCMHGSSEGQEWPPYEEQQQQQQAARASGLRRADDPWRAQLPVDGYAEEQQYTAASPWHSSPEAGAAAPWPTSWPPCHSHNRLHGEAVEQLDPGRGSCIHCAAACETGTEWQLGSCQSVEQPQASAEWSPACACMQARPPQHHPSAAAALADGLSPPHACCSYSPRSAACPASGRVSADGYSSGYRCAEHCSPLDSTRTVPVGSHFYPADLSPDQRRQQWTNAHASPLSTSVLGSHAAYPAAAATAAEPVRYFAGGLPVLSPDYRSPVAATVAATPAVLPAQCPPSARSQSPLQQLQTATSDSWKGASSGSQQQQQQAPVAYLPLPAATHAEQQQAGASGYVVILPLVPGHSTREQQQQQQQLQQQQLQQQAIAAAAAAAAMAGVGRQGVQHSASGHRLVSSPEPMLLLSTADTKGGPALYNGSFEARHYHSNEVRGSFARPNAHRHQGRMAAPRKWHSYDSVAEVGRSHSSRFDHVLTDTRLAASKVLNLSCQLMASLEKEVLVTSPDRG